MRLRGGAPPGALPKSIYNPPVIWTKSPDRRVLLYLFAACCLIGAVATAHQAYERWDPQTPVSEIISLRHRTRDEFLGSGFNVLAAITLVMFDLRRARAEKGLMWSPAAKDWLAHPLFAANGRVRWSVSFWRAVAWLMSLVFLTEAACGMYAAAEAMIVPPNTNFGGWTNTWYGTLMGALVQATLAVCTIAYDRHRSRLEDVVAGYCTKCGYDLRASPLRCPECGNAANRPSPA